MFCYLCTSMGDTAVARICESMQFNLDSDLFKISNIQILQYSSRSDPVSRSGKNHR